jgi:uridine kinase
LLKDILIYQDKIQYEGNDMLILGIAGGTGSGKTTVAKAISKQVGSQRVRIIHQDSYYLDQSHLPLEKREKINYDHPSALDMNLLKTHIKMLKQGEAIEKPIYDFKIHSRIKETEHIDPMDVLIIEGIFALQDAELREMLNIKIYVETDADIRFIRRLHRDIQERGRTVESVITQYRDIVRVMHMQFVEPTKQYADLIIPEGGQNKVAINVMVNTLREYIRRLSEGNPDPHTLLAQ